MKVLIWIGCLFISAIIQVAIKGDRVSLGAIPSVIFVLVTLWSASSLCKKWDYHKNKTTKITTSYTSRFTECPKCGYIAVFEKKCPKCGFILPTEVKEDNTSESSKILYCRKCGAKLLEGAKFCKECGTETITKVKESPKLPQ